MDGPFVSHENGKLESNTYKDGKLDGPWVRYYSDGH